jgi:UDP-GlcNAc3NAcA epimerase
LESNRFKIWDERGWKNEDCNDCGGEPQFIKAAAVKVAIHRAHRRKGHIEEVLVHTGQHYDTLMDKVFFEELNLPKPDYHLGVGSGSHGKQTGMMLERIESVLGKEKPEAVIVYGDTNSTLAGALAAAKLNFPIAQSRQG